MTDSSNNAMIQHIDQNQRRSRMVLHGDIIFLAGQCADDLTADISQQTHEALARIDRLLEEAGSDRSRLLSVQIWLTDIADLDAMNKVYDAWVVSGNAPTRCCCGDVALAIVGAKVEIIATAAI